MSVGEIVRQSFFNFNVKARRDLAKQIMSNPPIVISRRRENSPEIKIIVDKNRNIALKYDSYNSETRQWNLNDRDQKLHKLKIVGDHVCIKIQKSGRPDYAPIMSRDDLQALLKRALFLQVQSAASSNRHIPARKQVSHFGIAALQALIEGGAIPDGQISQLYGTIKDNLTRVVTDHREDPNSRRAIPGGDLAESAALVSQLCLGLSMAAQAFAE